MVGFCAQLWSVWQTKFKNKNKEIKMSKVKQKKDSGKVYTLEELKCLRDYMLQNGNFHDYETANNYAPYHYEKTGRERSGHALYMCAWRITEGKYNNILK